MKLEEILPELRKGRRARFLDGSEFSSWLTLIQLFEACSPKRIISNDWDLEPKKIKWVWQWRWRRKVDDLWSVNVTLMTEGLAERHFEEMATYEKHAGPFEVEE